MAEFLSCDWGTSSFRLRLVEAAGMRVLAEDSSDNGIASTFAAWSETGEEEPGKRVQFYLHVLRESVAKLEQTLSKSLKAIPVIISGMASSSIGLLELPYSQLPFAVDGADVRVKLIKRSSGFENPVLLISGVCSKDDVMRGEETQLMGIISDQAEEETEQVYILPGTHSKHIFVKDGLVKSFKTFMTGEFFELLSKKSILHVSVEANQEALQSESILQSYRQGVLAARGENLLHTAFLVRTNYLFEKLSKQENFSYLSGLLIGAELQEFCNTRDLKINLCCGSNLKAPYETALQVLGLYERAKVYAAQEIDAAAMKGHSKILNRFKDKL